jgi:hypothetical protein
MSLARTLADQLQYTVRGSLACAKAVLSCFDDMRSLSGSGILVSTLLEEIGETSLQC